MNIIKNAKGLVIALTLVTGSAQADLLSTDYVSDNFSFGNMFDVNVLETENTVTVTGFDLNFGYNGQLLTPETEDEVYTDGSGAGKVITSIYVYANITGSTWDINGDGSASPLDPRDLDYWERISVITDTVSAGSGNATYVDVDDFVLSAGINSIWITSTDSEQQLNYFGTDSIDAYTDDEGVYHDAFVGSETLSVGDVISADDNLEILAGAGLRVSGTADNVFTTRQFTGGIHYDVPAPTTIAIFGLALLGLAGARRKA